MDSDLHALSTDDLETSLVELEAMVARLRARQTCLLSEIDRRQVPWSDGCRTLAEWIGSRLDLAPETAARLVGVVTSESQPINDALAAGDITFDRAAELSRLDMEDLVTETAGYAIPRLRHLTARRRRITRRSEQEAHAQRRLVLQPNLEGTSVRLYGELVGVDSVRVEQILTRRADRFPALPEGHREPRHARLADALTCIVLDSATASGTGSTGTTAPASAQVTVFVDAADAAPTNGEAGVAIAGGPRVGPQALEAIMCDAIVEVIALTADGTPLAVGNGSSTIPGRIRRLVQHRDITCTADGCTSRYRLEPHHIRHREHHGSDDPDNLTLLCWFHHHVVIHGRGYRIDPDSTPGRWRFRPPPPARSGTDPPPT